MVRATHLILPHNLATLSTAHGVAPDRDLPGHFTLAVVSGIAAPKVDPRRGARGARSVKRLALDFGSGHDPFVRLSPTSGSTLTDGQEPAWDSLPLSVPPQLACFLTLSLSLSK